MKKRNLQLLLWVTQLGLMLTLPPIVLTAGAVWLRERFALGGWVVLLGVLLGLGTAVSGARDFFRFARRDEEEREGGDSVAFNAHD